MEKISGMGDSGDRRRGSAKSMAKGRSFSSSPYENGAATGSASSAAGATSSVRGPGSDHDESGVVG